MKLRKEDVYEHLEMLYEIVGEEKYLEIVRMYGGSNLYIPTYKATIRNGRNREIKKRYNGVLLLSMVWVLIIWEILLKKTK